MNLEQIILSLYGCILLSGAYFGWKSGSKISLIMGMSSGFLVFGGVYLLNVNALFGYIFLLVISGLLSVVVFPVRFVKTRKFIPAGMLLIVSNGAFIFSLIHFIRLN